MLFVLLLLVVPLPPDSMNPPASTVVFDHEGKLLRVYLSSEDAYLVPAALDDISPHLQAAFLTYEDRYFYAHPGLNPVAITRAAWMNLRAGKVLSGGSTITQQLARMIDPRPRTLPVKLLEAFRALQLELRYSKKEIFTAYLNRVPFGGNVIGVEAASQIYFGKPSRELGPGEAALLAAIPKSPANLRPDRYPEAARKRRDEVLRRMLENDVITSDQFDRAIAESAAHGWKPFPLYAPHVCDELAAASGRTGRKYTTTIDLKIQETARRLLERHVNQLRGFNISNGALVILENETGAVRALVGSADYFDEKNGGQVNGALAERSPGSTLKPFVYALGIDDGLLTPSTLLEDIPVSYSGYAPVNYDETFQGMITAQYALTHSLNVPAVNVLHDVGLTRLIGFLRQGGIHTLEKGPEHFGLSLILGGVGVRLLELTNLYAMLARQGEFISYRLLESQPVLQSKRLLTEGSAFIITDMLTEVRRPDFPSTWEYTANLPKIAWKTGTSYGNRDAWSIGYTPRYTIGVWIGNFSGVGAPALVGADAAGPLLFDLFTALEAGKGEWYLRPVEVDEREVCALSGMLPGPGCTEIKRELYHVDYSLREECTFHQVYEIDDATGYRLCPSCRVGKYYQEKVFVTWPSKITAWRRSVGLPLETIPQHDPKCSRIAGENAPSIRSPEEGITYIIRRFVPLEDQQIPLEAAFGSDVKTVYWFVDRELIFEGKPDQLVFWPPERGKHTVTCMDDEGREASREIVVE